MSDTLQRRVMIVEDEAATQLALEETLKKLGYVVAGSAMRGGEAIEKALATKPDVILMDITLADGTDGVQAAAAICEQLDVPVVYLTAHGDTKTIERATRGAPFGYLVKPFQAPMLQAALEVALYRHGFERRTKELARALERFNTDLEDQVRKRTEELKAAMRELEAFSYSVAHDLRTPLRTISANAGLLEQDLIDQHLYEQLKDAARVHLARIQNTANYMGALIDALLHLSRTARAPLTRRPLDMDALVRQAADAASIDYPNARILFAPLPAADGDAVLVRQVWANLISNACKFSAGRADAVVQIGASERDGMTTYWVRDQGVGFDMAYANKLFRPFERLHTEKEFEGIGIGLALVKRIVERHGGEVGAESAPGEGATFWFTLSAAAKR